MNHASPLREVILSAAAGAVAFGLAGFNLWLAASLGLFGWSLIRTFAVSDQHFPMVPLTVLLASTQWAVMPAIAYGIDFWHFKARMYCSEEEYMPIACGGLIAYSIGLAAGCSRRHLRTTGQAMDALARFMRSKPRTPWALAAIAAASILIRPSVPGALAFPVLLLGQARYAAVLILILQKKRSALPGLMALMAFEAWSATRGAMFHDLILWGAILTVAYLHCFKIRVRSRLLVLGAGVVLVAGLQVVKSDYREGKWDGGTRTEGLESVASGRVNQLNSVNGWLRELEAQLPRFNQGWIISAAIAYTPRYSPYLEGESIADAVVASAAPRAFMATKVKAGSTKLITKTTGLEIARGASMGLSPVGESYVNFGPLWGSAFMLLVGFLYASAFRAMTSLAVRWPVLLAFIPAALQYSMRAEGEFAGGFNHLAKALLLYSVLAFLISRVDWRPERLRI
ncbi:hypothetical protein N9L45_00900, partial [Planctomycetota bacterium]|nr:hypothetical protein [Planctomycetota bacterium]